jgi:membrane protease YdiL (CAAX protease family)
MLTDKPWRPDQVFQLLIGLFASRFLGMLILGGVHATKWLSESAFQALTILIGTLSFHGVAFVLIWLLLRAYHLKWSEAFGFAAPRLGRSLLLAILVAMAVLPIAWSLGQLSARIMTGLHFQPVVQSPVQILQAGSNLPLKLTIGLIAIVVAPFVEELVFRGLVYPTLKQQGFPRLALWGTSLLFAAVHENAMIFLPLTFLAVILTLLYESTENLLTSILTHSLFNFVNFFWVVAQPALQLPRGSL